MSRIHIGKAGRGVKMWHLSHFDARLTGKMKRLERY